MKQNYFLINSFVSLFILLSTIQINALKSELSEDNGSMNNSTHDQFFTNNTLREINNIVRDKLMNSGEKDQQKLLNIFKSELQGIEEFKKIADHSTIYKIAIPQLAFSKKSNDLLLQGDELILSMSKAQSSNSHCFTRAIFSSLLGFTVANLGSAFLRLAGIIDNNLVNKISTNLTGLTLGCCVWALDCWGISKRLYIIEKRIAERKKFSAISQSLIDNLK